MNQSTFVVIPSQFRSVLSSNQCRTIPTATELVVIPSQFRSVLSKRRIPARDEKHKSVIPSQFRSVLSQSPSNNRYASASGRNPFSIQVSSLGELIGLSVYRCHVVIPSQFRSVLSSVVNALIAEDRARRNPFSIQVSSLKAPADHQIGSNTWVVIPSQFRSVLS